MKKVVLSLAVLFSVALVSCNNTKNAEAVDSDSVVVVEEVAEVAVDSVAPDSVAVDTTVAVAEVAE